MTRPTIDPHHFETFDRDDVTMVELRSTPIGAIVRRGVRTSDRTYELDLLIYATGFDATLCCAETSRRRAVEGSRCPD